MSKRYLGNEPCTSPEQVIRYLTENYQDAEGNLMPAEVARQIVNGQPDQLTRGIKVFRSNVYYLGDEALASSGIQGWTEVPEEEDSEKEEDW